jgi:hypothetical protein
MTFGVASGWGSGVAGSSATVSSRKALVAHRKRDSHPDDQGGLLGGILLATLGAERYR